MVYENQTRYSLREPINLKEREQRIDKSEKNRRRDKNGKIAHAVFTELAGTKIVQFFASSAAYTCMRTQFHGPCPHY